MPLWAGWKLFPSPEARLVNPLIRFAASWMLACGLKLETETDKTV